MKTDHELGSERAPTLTATHRLNGTLLFATLAASLGGLLFGFDTIVISGCQSQLTAKFQLNGFWQGFMTASALVGTAVGAMFAGKPGDLFGRRDCLKLCGVLYLISAIGCGFAWDFWSLIAFRFVGGIGVGASSVLAPLYLAEVSPAAWRGRLVAFFQFNVVLGVLVALMSNYIIDVIFKSYPIESGFASETWRWKLGVQAIPACAFFIALYYIPRSPRWLAMHGKEAEAIQSLTRIGASDPPQLLAQIRRSLQRDQSLPAQPLFARENAKPLFLAFTVASFNQFGGINALWYYLNPILESGGFSSDDAGMATILLGVANLIATIVGMVLIDHAGRKPLLLWGAAGTLLTMSVVAYIFTTGNLTSLLVWLLTGVVICHAFGQGAVVWVYISEVFPNEVRAQGQAFGSFTHWFWAMVVSWTFPMLAGNVGSPGAGTPFAFFAFMMVLQILIVWLLFPETKQIPLEAMHGNSDSKQSAEGL